jgi:chromosome segregation ATPase
MGALWNRVVGVGQPSEAATARNETDAPAAAVGAALQRFAPQEPLETIGMHNEALREQLEEVEHGLGQIERVRGLFQAVQTPISELMSEYEAAKARVSEARTRLSALEEAQQTLSARHAETIEERDLLAEARNALTRENREAAQRVQRLDAVLAETQADLRERVAANEKLDRLIEVETRRNGALADELRRLKEELSNKDQRLAGLEVALKTASDQGAMLSQENEGLRESAQNLANQLDAANRRAAEGEARVADCEMAIDQAKHRLAALEQSLADEQATHANLRAKHLEQVERNRGEMARLGDAVLAMRGRIDVTNRILDQTRGQLREKIEELRAAERRLMENAIQIDALEKSERSLKDDLASANERLAGAERARRALTDQVGALTEDVRAKDTALQSAARSVEQLTARVEEAAKNRQRERDESERRTVALQNEVARVRAERRLADGALEASRAERQQARRAPPPRLDGRLAEPAEAAGAPSPGDVGKLSVAAE